MLSEISIKVKAIDGLIENRTIEAKVFGELAVHEHILGRYWTVAHVKSGCAIAHFSQREVAESFTDVCQNIGLNLDFDHTRFHDLNSPEARDRLVRLIRDYEDLDKYRGNLQHAAN